MKLLKGLGYTVKNIHADSFKQGLMTPEENKALIQFIFTDITAASNN